MANVNAWTDGGYLNPLCRIDVAMGHESGVQVESRREESRCV